MAVDMFTLSGIISNVSKSIADITKTISDNTTERERIRMQGRKIDADVADRMKERDAETRRFFQEQQAKLDSLCMERDARLAELKIETAQNKSTYIKEVKQMELNHKEHMAGLENQRRRDDATHRERMELLAIIRDCVGEANRRMVIYRDDRIRYGQEYFPIEGIIVGITQATESLNVAAQTLMLPSRGD